MDQKLILLVDDDRAVLERVSDYFEHFGLSILTTTEVFAVSRLVTERKPDVIVLDVNMPTLAGDRLAETLSKFYQLPIIFYSAITTAEGAALARNCARARFVSKADGVRNLFAAVKRTLELRDSDAPVSANG